MCCFVKFKLRICTLFFKLAQKFKSVYVWTLYWEVNAIVFQGTMLWSQSFCDFHQFSAKKALFLKNNTIHFLQNSAVFFVINANFVADFFDKNIFLIITSDFDHIIYIRSQPLKSSFDQVSYLTVHICMCIRKLLSVAMALSFSWYQTVMQMCFGKFVIKPAAAKSLSTHPIYFLTRFSIVNQVRSEKKCPRGIW
jgi:hypothetical protein